MDHTVPLMSTRFLTPVKPVYSCPCAIELLQLSLDFFGYMPRGPNVATSLCIVSNAKQDLSYFCMLPLFETPSRLSGTSWQMHDEGTIEQ